MWLVLIEIRLEINKLLWKGEASIIALGKRPCLSKNLITETPIDKTPGTDVVVQVTADMSEHEIGKMLEEEGLVRDGTLFYAQLKLSAYSGELLPGTYTLNTSMTGKDMIVVMATEPEESTEAVDSEETP